MNDEIETTTCWADDERILTITSNKGPLMYFPSTADYVEIMGHKIDFEGGYKEFVEHLHKLATYEEENKQLKKQYCERVDCAARLGESKKVEELKTSVKYYVDILTDLKKWLEDTYDYVDCIKIKHVLNEIKELEEKHNG